MPSLFPDKLNVCMVIDNLKKQYKNMTVSLIFFFLATFNLAGITPLLREGVKVKMNVGPVILFQTQPTECSLHRLRISNYGP